MRAEEYLASRGFTDAQAIKGWGACIDRDVDRLERLWVPWRDEQGKVVYESGRLLDAALLERAKPPPKWRHRGSNGRATRR